NRDLFLVIGADPTGEILRLDAATGTVVWSRDVSASTSIPFYPNNIVASSDGMLFVGGSRVQFGSNRGRFEIHGYNLAGVRQWANDESIGMLHGLGIDPATDEVVAFGQSHIFSPYLIGIVARYTNTGQMRWRDVTGTFGMIGWDWGSLWNDPVDDLVIDTAGNTYALANGHAGIDPDTNPLAFALESTFPNGGSRYSIQYVGEYSFSSGQVGDLHVSAVAADSSGNAYVVGHQQDCVSGCQSEFTVWSFGPDGVERWRRTPSVASGMSGSGLAVFVDGEDRIVVNGRAGGQVINARFLADGTEIGFEERSLESPIDLIIGHLDYASDFVGNSFLTYSVAGAAGRVTTRLQRLMAGESVGVAYCGPAVPNSTGISADMDAIGRGSSAANNLSLRVTDLPVGAPVLMLASTTEANLPGVGGGQGTLCLGGAIGRYVGPGQVRVADASGSAWLQLDLMQVPQPTGSVPAMAGDVWRFQSWYRDVNPLPTSNLSNGVAVTLTP
ncbi:MAG: PQQ-binding-like beta-propeller repeat protein, partial [Planctomycetota bacterium]